MTRRAARPAAAALVLLLAGAVAGYPEAPASPGLGPALPAAMSRIQGSLEALRGHRFGGAVAAASLEPSAVRAYLGAKLREEYPGAAIAAEHAAYVHFALLSPDDDLESLFLDLLSDQAAGFYDPEKKVLFLVPGRSIAAEALVHELVHALQDRTFDVAAILRAARPDDDRLLAAQAMIEGEATALAEIYSKEHPDLPDPFARSGAESSPDDDAARARRLAAAPAVLREGLMFGYSRGRTWADAVLRAGGHDLMDSMFRAPPDSTEQILHPEKSLAPRDVPSRLDRGLMPDLTHLGYRTVKANTLGEFQLRLILGGASDRGAASAAAGWDGDVYAVYERAGGGTSLLWASAWDSPGDAEEFRRAAASWLAGRHAAGGVSRAAAAGSDGRFVVLVEGFDEVLAGRLEADLRGRLEEERILR